MARELREILNNAVRHVAAAIQKKREGFESMNKRLSILLLASITCFLSTTPAHAQQLHAILVSDQSEWAHWGEHLPSIQMDMLHMVMTLEENIPRGQLDLHRLDIELEPGSPDQLLAVLEQVKVRPQDTLLLYFTGHGGADDQGHYLDLEKGKLYRAELRKKMLGKGARLSAIITDCCNVRGDKFAYFAPAFDSKRPRAVTSLFQSLFFEPSGIVDINGSSPSEGAFFFIEKDELDLPQGSLFSRSLTKYWEKNSGKSLTWNEVLRQVSFDVHEAFRRNYPKGAGEGKGNNRQQVQSVYAISYPGMPEQKGPRTGVTVRDHAGTGALITEVRPDFPGAQVFDLGSRQYVSLQKDQVIVAANGRPVVNVKDFVENVKESPQVMRLKISDPKRGEKEYLMRLRY